MDALPHAVEAYIGHCTNQETRTLARDAVKLIWDNIEKAYRNGADRSARANMLTASHKAGRVFSKSYVGYIYAVPHSLGGQYNIPHGSANAVLLPIVLEAHGSIIHKSCTSWLSLPACLGCRFLPRGRRKTHPGVCYLNQQMQIPAFLSGIQKADTPRMASSPPKKPTRFT